MYTLCMFIAHLCFRAASLQRLSPFMTRHYYSIITATLWTDNAEALELDNVASLKGILVTKPTTEWNWIEDCFAGCVFAVLFVLSHTPALPIP